MNSFAQSELTCCCTQKYAVNKHCFPADLKRGGVDAETAQRILSAWEETGAKSAEGLRKLLVGRSLKTAGIIGLQTLLDAGNPPLCLGKKKFGAHHNPHL